jgi:hypothetical protein
MVSRLYYAFGVMLVVIVLFLVFRNALHVLTP